LEVKDTYNTINLRPKKYYIKKKNSKFSVLPIYSIGRRSKIIDGLRKKHPNAGHFCCLSNRHRHHSYRANDDGEPSNSAGMPIYGQILSFSLTNILVVVARVLAALN
jgi:putative IMPACT (imprinted ancient) family translation regulator